MIYGQMQNTKEQNNVENRNFKTAEDCGAVGDCTNTNTNIYTN